MYKVDFSQTALKSLEQLYRSDKKLYQRLLTNIEFLERDPYMGKALKGPLKGQWSLRVGHYRIVYSIFRDKLLIIVIDVGHRKSIYQ